MTKRKIILVPDEILKKKSEKIEKLTNKEKQLADDLFETMYKNNGIGLAAVQIGVLRRMLVIDVSKKDEEKKPLCLINPVIKSFGKGRSTYEEGCLSIPDVFARVVRPAEIVVSYQNELGEDEKQSLDGLTARVFQHELDHLDGILFIDRVGPFTRQRAFEKAKKIQKMRRRGKEKFKARFAL